MTRPAPPVSPDVAGGDVVAVGHEIGRIASEGTIIGRAEPYAKVFASSRQVKRAAGVMAWAILEDIALDAHLNDHGRLVATTNVRRIADNLGVSQNTVATHLTRLRDAGFVLHEEGDHDDTGRYTTSRYILDPSACVERLTHTPSRHDPADTTDHDPSPSPIAATHDTTDETDHESAPPARTNLMPTTRWTITRQPIGPNRPQSPNLDRVPNLGTRTRRPCPNPWDTVNWDTTTKKK